MDFNPMMPIWLQVVTAIKHDLVCRIIQPGSKLPGGRDLAVKYSINPNTAARVYQELEKEGICETRRGLGTFATGDPDRIESLRRTMARDAITGFLREMEQLGYSHAESLALLTEEENAHAGE